MRNTKKQRLLETLLAHNEQRTTGWHQVTNRILLEGMTLAQLEEWAKALKVTPLN